MTPLTLVAPADTGLERRSGTLGLAGSFAIGAAAGAALTVNGYSEVFHSAKLGIWLVVLVAIHLLRFPRLVITREAIVYACFITYMLIQLTWTINWTLARNTLVPAIDFLLIVVLYSSLLAYHDMRAVLSGSFAGFVAGAMSYSVATGFPFSYPPDFSYNAVAGMYLFGLFLALLLLTFGRFRLILVGCSAILVALMLATTSIKTNLGVLLGVAIACVLYLRYFVGIIRRYFWLFLALAALLGFMIATNEDLSAALQRGLERISLGIEILRAREDLPGYSAYEKRSSWLLQGIEGWSQNPLFGHGVEAIRNDLGVTAHSTPVDLLYNSGVIGLLLFYSLFVSLASRLGSLRIAGANAIKTLFAGTAACYLFMSAASPLHYYGFLAAIIAISAAVLAGFRPSSGVET